MRFINTFLLCVLCLYVGFQASTASALDMPDDIQSVSVLADPSLALPLTEIALDYSRQKHSSVALAFKPVNQQESEVTDGATYDILITAKPKLLESLKQQGLVDIYSEVPIAKNQLVLVAAKTNPFTANFSNGFPLATMVNHFDWRAGLLLGNPETLLEGTLAREALRKYDVLEDLEPYIIYIREMPEMIQMVEHEGQLAFVFASEAKQHQSLRVLDIVPDTVSDPVRYTAVVLAGDNMDEARKFLDYLKQVRTQQIFEKFGYQKP